MKQQKNLHLIKLSLILCPLLLWACTSTTNLDKQLAYHYLPYIIEDNITFTKPGLQIPVENINPQELTTEFPKKTKYIFIRLYDPKYSNPLYIANLLKAGINITELTDNFVSHASINTRLNDDFYGLTMGGKFQLAHESCTNVKGHKYMDKCDPLTSTQITFAIQVSEEEYNNLQQNLDDYSKDPTLAYNAFENFKIAIYDIGRRFFTPAKYQNVQNGYYLPTVRRKDVKNFVCSTFIAYLLINNIPEVSNWFDTYKIDYSYINVSDLIQIPGMTRLFSSTWENYNIAAEGFVHKYSEFAEYLHN